MSGSESSPSSLARYHGIAIALLVAGCLVAGWGCGDDSEEQSLEQFEGLNGAEILERLDEIDVDGRDPSRVRVATTVETGSDRIERVMEMSVDGSSLQVALFEEGEPVSELLVYGGEIYTRDYGADEWDSEADPEIVLDFQFARPALFEDGTDGEKTGGPSPVVTRLADEVADGETQMVLRIEVSGLELDEESLSSPFVGKISAWLGGHLPAPSMPPFSTADVTVSVWIDGNKLEPSRFEAKAKVFADGERILTRMEQFEVVDYGRVDIEAPVLVAE